MSEERGPIEPLSVRLPHSFKHHIRYLNRSFWQGRQGQTFSFSRPIDVLYFPPLWFLVFSPFLFFERRTAVSYVLGMLDALFHPNNLLASLRLWCSFWESEQCRHVCHFGRIDAPASLLKTRLQWHWSWRGSPSLWWDNGRIWHNEWTGERLIAHMSVWIQHWLWVWWRPNHFFFFF